MAEVSWEVTLTVNATLERDHEDEDHMPTVAESMEIDRTLKSAIEDAKPDEAGEWRIEYWEVAV